MIVPLNVPAIAISIKRRGWCWFYFIIEAGLATLQIGPIVIELAE